MPAVSTTSVSPKAAMAIQEKDRSMLKTLVVVRNVSVAMVRNAHQSRKMMRMPASWTLM